MRWPSVRWVMYVRVCCGAVCSISYGSLPASFFSRVWFGLCRAVFLLCPLTLGYGGWGGCRSSVGLCTSWFLVVFRLGLLCVRAVCLESCAVHFICLLFYCFSSRLSLLPFPFRFLICSVSIRICVRFLEFFRLWLAILGSRFHCCLSHWGLGMALRFRFFYRFWTTSLGGVFFFGDLCPVLPFFLLVYVFLVSIGIKFSFFVR